MRPPNGSNTYANSLSPLIPRSVLGWKQSYNYGSPVAVIEAIVTHALEQLTLDYYRRNHLATASYELRSDEDID